MTPFSGRLTKQEINLINRLFTSGIVTAKVGAADTDSQVTHYLLYPQKIDHYLQYTFGYRIEHYNQCLLLNSNQLSLKSDEIAVILAFIRFVINNGTTDQAFEYQAPLMPIEAVLSGLHLNLRTSSKTQNRIIDILTTYLVNQFQVLDLQWFSDEIDSEGAGTQYWVYDDSFFSFAQLLVNHLNNQLTTPTKTIDPRQQLNRLLLSQFFLDATSDPHSWQFLQENRSLIAQEWSILTPYELEITDDYAIVLTHNRRPSQSQSTITAIGVARQLNAKGLNHTQLRQRIISEFHHHYHKPPTSADIGGALKQLWRLHLIQIIDHQYHKTNLTDRFSVSTNQADLNIRYSRQ
ncbi:hypothetical protein [Secundilactobacillus similis]|uniref:Uncharacterized protein n=1 Tax=Secundilactobacillus similis DSM 23365 = JCM 2765 TaxID=1423804 RepID=A0A0R2EZF1_9LACO|nr:hypothetical protein [Secundilactobacillus similis]KRN21518.1 hypothetical protein FD14_GL001036 [Secundilactobacillus similis DSM 23365 = JCM 2765]